MNKNRTYDIIPLPKETYKGAILPISYTTTGYYDVSVDGFDVSIRKKTFPFPVTHTPEEYDFPDRLYADWWEAQRLSGLWTAWSCSPRSRPVRRSGRTVLS